MYILFIKSPQPAYLNYVGIHEAPEGSLDSMQFHSYSIIYGAYKI